MLDAESRDRLRRKGLRLVWIGEAWNGMEAVVGIAAAWRSGSVALYAFGLDSIVELFAGLVLIWRLRGEWGAREEAAAERRALRLLGATFFFLAAYIAFQALATLLRFFAEPSASLPGIVVVLASAIVMLILYLRKSAIARQIGSRALRAEAVESLVCDVQDVTVLGGLALNAWLGWWWADPIAALFLVPLLLKEGWEAFSEERGAAAKPI